MSQAKVKMGLYIHIPFCQKKCHYCNFLTFTDQANEVDPYIDYLIREMAFYQEQNYLIDTIYFGGGTPSYLSADQMVRVMEGVYRYFEVSQRAEISIEMNPESVTSRRLDSYLECGFNRFSMGVQSFNDEVLKMMGRLHDRATVFEKIELMKNKGIDRLGIDLMFANPKQTWEILEDDLNQALTLPLTHLSIYSLMIKDDTPLKRWVLTGQVKLPSEELERTMYHYIQERLKAAGFEQYEISNFARPGYESRHNKKYWRLDNYLGLGLGASSNVDLIRYDNERSFSAYYQKIDQGLPPVMSQEVMTLEDREKEYIMLNMRLLKGFSIPEINQRFGIDFLTKYQKAIEKHLNTGIIQLSEDRIAFTELGLDIGNQFYLDIL